MHLVDFPTFISNKKDNFYHFMFMYLPSEKVSALKASDVLFAFLQTKSFLERGLL